MCIWAGVFIAIFWYHWKNKAIGVGLTFSFLLNFAMNHLFGGMIYMLPWYANQKDADFVKAGFLQSSYALLYFGIGIVFLGPLLIRFFGFTSVENKRSFSFNPELPVFYIIFGILISVLSEFGLAKIPGIQAFASTGVTFILTGICLLCWKAWLQKRRKKLTTMLAVAFLFPLLTVVFKGFLGFGTSILIAILVFVASFYRPRWKIVLVGILSFYLGLSLFVTYFRDRGELRTVIWEENRPIKERVQMVLKTVTNFEFLNLYNVDHLNRIDLRLNQNMLIGATIFYLKEGYERYARGETIWAGILAMIPRAIWSNKPVLAGGSALVSKYTGMKFDEDTSVGIGPVMEFYVNFGPPGVLIGFLLLGVILSFFDAMAAAHLFRGDWQGFAFWFLPGLGFIQVIGSMVEITSTVAASFVCCWFVHKCVLPVLPKRPSTISAFYQKQGHSGGGIVRP